MTTTLRASSDQYDQDGVLDLIRKHVELHDRGFAARPDWAHQSLFHLLLDLGRRFVVSSRPRDLVGMPKKLCYANSAAYATQHQAEGIVYAEGMASIKVGGADFPLPHAWVVRPDGTVIDPTWGDIPGQTYIGVPIADPGLWPVDGWGSSRTLRRRWRCCATGSQRRLLLMSGAH